MIKQKDYGKNSWMNWIWIRQYFKPTFLKYLGEMSLQVKSVFLEHYMSESNPPPPSMS